MTATAATTTTLDRQKVLNTAVAQIIKQGGPSSDNMGNCFYRSPDGSGRMCSVGANIPEERYSRALEGILCLPVLAAVEPGASTDDIFFLAELQADTHDRLTQEGVSDAAFLAAFPSAVATFAAEQGLKNPLAEGSSS